MGSAEGSALIPCNVDIDLIGMEDKPDSDKDSVSLKPPQTETCHKERLGDIDQNHI